MVYLPGSLRGNKCVRIHPGKPNLKNIKRNECLGYYAFFHHFSSCRFKVKKVLSDCRTWNFFKFLGDILLNNAINKAYVRHSRLINKQMRSFIPSEPKIASSILLFFSFATTWSFGNLGKRQKFENFTDLDFV